MAELFPDLCDSSKVERFEFDSRPRPIIRLYKPVVISSIEATLRAYETYAGIDKYLHIVGAAFYYQSCSFRRIFVERIMHWRKYEANLAEWEATHELRRAEIKAESDEWINNCRLKIAEIQSRVAIKHYCRFQVPFL